MTPARWLLGVGAYMLGIVTIVLLRGEDVADVLPELAGAGTFGLVAVAVLWFALRRRPGG